MYAKLHQRTKHLHFTGSDYNGRQIIIDAAEMRSDKFDVVALRPNGDEVETRTTDTLEHATDLYNKMVTYHTTGTTPGMYTREDWQRDRNFSAAPGQEIQPEIFADMRDVVPPLPLPERMKKLGFSGFLMGEPQTHNAHGPVYKAFVRSNGHFYYFGLVNYY